MSDLTSMINIGNEKLKETYPQVCLVHLYALEGAILNTEFNSLSEDMKKELREFSDAPSLLPEQKVSTDPPAPVSKAAPFCQYRLRTLSGFRLSRLLCDRV